MRAMPSPISMTVPSSLSSSFCSRPWISRLRSLVISATLMAMLLPRVSGFGFRDFLKGCRAGMLGFPETRHPKPDTRSSLRCARQQLFPHRVQLRAHAGVDEAVLHAQDESADDTIVNVFVDDRFLAKRLADALL